MELHVLKPNNPKLRTVATPLSRADLRTRATQNLIEQLLEFVTGHNNKGETRKKTEPMTVGLSGPQMGIERRISIVDLAIGNKYYHDIRVLINPEITTRSKATVTHHEGCVNLPKIWGPVVRHRAVTVRALDRSGNIITIEATGWPAVLLQHEIDHLNGRLFIDYLPDPTKAHVLDAKHFRAYNKKTAPTWPHTKDVTAWIKPL